MHTRRGSLVSLRTIYCGGPGRNSQAATYVARKLNVRLFVLRSLKSSSLGRHRLGVAAALCLGLAEDV